MIWYDISAIGLTTGGSNTAHVYIQTKQYTEYTEQNKYNNHKIEHA
jgi:hypothetical protein